MSLAEHDVLDRQRSHRLPERLRTAHAGRVRPDCYNNAHRSGGDLIDSLTGAGIAQVPNSHSAVLDGISQCAPGSEPFSVTSRRGL